METPDFYMAELTLAFTTPCLAGAFDSTVGHYVFDRDSASNVTFSVKYWRKMIKDAMDIYAPDLTAHLAKIRPDTIRFGMIGVRIHADSGQQYECLPVNSELTISFIVPSAIPLDKFKLLLDKAGQWIGFSPAKAHLGFGRFKIVRAEQQNVE